MNEQTSIVETNTSITPKIGRSSIFRPLWWILQSIVIGIWKMVLSFVLMWQFLHIFVTGEKHAWSSEFTRKFIHHVVAWTEYTFWIRDERPEIIEY